MNHMTNPKCFAFAPILLLIGCGSKQPAPQVVAATAEPPAATVPQSQPEQPPAQPAVQYSTQQQQAPPQQQPPQQQALPPRQQAITLPEGTLIQVRRAETLDTKRNRTGDRFRATLDAPIRENGVEIVPRGAYFSGRVDTSKPSGRLKGRAAMTLELDSFEFHGRTYQISTSHTSRVSGRHRKRNLIAIGGGTGAGAGIGALAGGPAGALIGAGAGAGAGTLGAVFTGKKNVSLPVETRLSFELRRPVQL
jgi:hypothetical protein